MPSVHVKSDLIWLRTSDALLGCARLCCAWIARYSTFLVRSSRGSVESSQYSVGPGQGPDYSRGLELNTTAHRTYVRGR